MFFNHFVLIAIFTIMQRLLRRGSYFFSKVTEVIETERTLISKFELRNFSDSVKLAIKAGNGGNGVLTFYADKKVRFGAPDGGDGGEGGDIRIQAHQAMHDLSHLRIKTIEGVDGQSGGAGGKLGKNGGKTLIRVPCGTLVYDIRIEEEKEHRTFVADLGRNKQECLIAKGGAAGRGNKNHPTTTGDQRLGKEGEMKIIYLELKTLADIGLVGFPNIGKSTFLAASTRALPKIANYQFTTLKPSVGHVKFVDDYFMTIADIPGIIQDAHQDKGLGFEFLRHIERTKILIFMLDITQKDPLEQYRILQKELHQYKGDAFKDRKRIVVFNKADCLANSQQKYRIFAGNISAKTFLVSAKEGSGVGQVLVELRRLKEELDQKQKQQQEVRRLYEEKSQKVKH